MSSNSISINVKASNDRKCVISVQPSETTVLELKQRLYSENENCDTPAERMRLIYSGRVLKDLDTLDKYKILEGHTIHMVRSLVPSPSTTTTTTTTITASTTTTDATAATTTTNPIDTTVPTPSSSQTSNSRSSQEATTAAAGAPLPNPWANLMTGGMGGGGGVSGMEANAMIQMMQDPTFAQYMSSMLQSPQVLESMISMNPSLGPHREEARQMIRSPLFQQMISNPDTLRHIAQSGPGALGRGGAGFGGGMNQWNNLSSIPTASPSPIGAANRTNPMASLWPMMGNGARGSAPIPTTATAGSNQTASPSPEERFQVQLKQLNEMGFWDPSKNIKALLAAGGNVNSAIELLFSGTV
ncbi:hypothetical protein BGZ76_000181 [Entomortierella beljakovae]|nr:hypothetical protein BGZ76_000181 [Entomortierella beljakovae]